MFPYNLCLKPKKNCGEEEQKKNKYIETQTNTQNIQPGFSVCMNIECMHNTSTMPIYITHRNQMAWHGIVWLVLLVLPVINSQRFARRAYVVYVFTQVD